MDVSIVIPVKNGGALLGEVLEAVFAQETEYEYEVICVDSGSTDDSKEIISRWPCRLFCIEPSEFGHGKTRNYGASQGTGEFIVFLTQDAKPANKDWLQSFIDAMHMDENIAGGFGQHLTYPGCNVLDVRDMPVHFANFGTANRVIRIEDYDRYQKDIGYRMHLAYFSDNNSCLRRSVWEKYPYADVNFAEDQQWARRVIEDGYATVYCPGAQVYHSHNFPLKTYFKRFYDEFKGLYDVYGYRAFEDKSSMRREIIRMDKVDVRYILGLNISTKEKLSSIRFALSRNKSRCKGAFYGGNYEFFPVQVRDYMDTHFSQQYQQIGVKKAKRVYTKQEKKVYRQWLFLSKEYRADLPETDPIFDKNREAWTFEVAPGSDVAKSRPKSAADPCNEFHIVVDENGFDFNREDYEAAKAGDDRLTINWVMPAPGKGSGGHTTLARFITGLEKRGFHNRIYLITAHTFQSDDECLQFWKDNFTMDFTGVEVHIYYSEMKYADAVVATTWQTAYAVNRCNNCISKFYFVQDFEPHFYPVGGEYALAENTYRLGMHGICASPYLAREVSRYGMSADYFGFSYDRNIYKPYPRKDDKQRVCFYARSFTARRSFEVGMLALERLSKLRPHVEIILAGDDLSGCRIPFRHINCGVVSPAELAYIYSQSDLSLVFSNTNLSLAPLEIMGSGSVCVCNGGACSEWLVNDDNSVIVDFDPIHVADTLIYYLDHPEMLDSKREAGAKFAATTSWDKEIDKVKKVFELEIMQDRVKLEERLAAAD